MATSQFPAITSFQSDWKRKIGGPALPRRAKWEEPWDPESHRISTPSLSTLCINTKGENILHLVKRGFKGTIFTPYLPTHLQKCALHTVSFSFSLSLSHTHKHTHTHTRTHTHTHIHVVQLSMYGVLKNAQPLFQNPAKNIFMNQFTKTHVPGFQIKQRAGNEWESREGWPRPFLAPWLQSVSLPKVDF